MLDAGVGPRHHHTLLNLQDPSMRPIETATEPVEITGEAGELAALVALAAELHRSNDEAVQALDRALASIAATRAQLDASADHRAYCRG